MSEQMNTILELTFSSMVVKKSLEGFDGSFLAHPEQTRDADIDLIDRGQVFVAFGVLDFIDADGVDLAQRPALQT